MCDKCTKEVHVSFLSLNFAHLDTFDVCKNAHQFGTCEVPLTIIGIPSVKRVLCIFHVQKQMLLLTLAERSGVNAALGRVQTGVLWFGCSAEVCAVFIRFTHIFSWGPIVSVCAHFCHVF